jgi:phage-related protein
VLSFGNVQIQINVEKSIIKGIKVYTDSLDTDIASKIENALLLQPFDLAKIKEVLQNSLSNSQAIELVSLFEKQLFI